MAGYYRTFIPDFAGIGKPLFDTLKDTHAEKLSAPEEVKQVVDKLQTWETPFMLECTYDEVVILKHSLQSPKIFQLKNPTSKGWGRYARFDEVHDRLLLHSQQCQGLILFLGMIPAH